MRTRTRSQSYQQHVPEGPNKGWGNMLFHMGHRGARAGCKDFSLSLSSCCSDQKVTCVYEDADNGSQRCKGRMQGHQEGGGRKRFRQSSATLHFVLCTLHFEKGFSTLLPLCTNSFQGALLRHALIAGARGCVAKASIFNQDPRFIFSLT